MMFVDSIQNLWIPFHWTHTIIMVVCYGAMVVWSMVAMVVNIRVRIDVWTVVSVLGLVFKLMLVFE
jgi:hypothetical protein